MRFFTVAAAAMMLNVLSAPASAVWLTVTPDFQRTVPGNTISVAIQASALPQNEVITYFNLLLGYDTDRLTAISIDYSGALGVIDSDAFPNDPEVLAYSIPADLPAGYSNYGGLHDTAVNFGSISVADPVSVLGPLQATEPFTLATISFAVAPLDGFTDSILQLMDDSFFDIEEDFGGNFDIKGEDGFTALASDLSSAKARIPQPATLLLILPLLGMLALRRRV